MLWSILFGVTCWMLWNRRNYFFFTNNLSSLDSLLYKAVHSAREFVQALSMVYGCFGLTLEHSFPLKWKPPDDPLLKLNVDGSWRSQDKMASSGELLRDSLGCWIRGFVANFKRNIALSAKFQTIAEGLKVVKHTHVNYLVVELNCLEAIEVLCGKSKPPRHLDLIFQEVEELKKCFKNIQFNHVYTEANAATYWLGKWAQDNHLGVCFLDAPSRTWSHFWLKIPQVRIIFLSFSSSFPYQKKSKFR